MGQALKLFRIESERLKLPTPFGRRIAEPLDADTAGLVTFRGCFDKIGLEEGERDMLTASRLLSEHRPRRLGSGRPKAASGDIDPVSNLKEQGRTRTRGPFALPLMS